MDTETEKIIELLFKETPELWNQNPHFYQYLTRIGEYDMDRLNKEPEHILDQKNDVYSNIQDLISTNYKVFINASENSRQIFSEFCHTEFRLYELLEQIPLFIEKCIAFCDISKNINVRKRFNNLILYKSTEIIEILELPLLMELCLQSNQYNEALELLQYSRYLRIKYEDLPIIANIINDIENSWSIMITQVVDSLKEDLPLSRCLQLIGLLRSMDAFSESELRIKFIQARDSWFNILLKSIPTDDCNIHLTKTIEFSRIHLFNIITQYKAIFNDDDHLVLGQDSAINDSAIFHEWLEDKISQFLTTLEHDLPEVTSIDSILGQCTYFGLSFGRIGADFTGRMSDIFIKVTNNKFEISISKITKKIENDLEDFSLIHKFQKDVKIEPIVNFENPPEQLLEFYPLAEYCNGVTTSLNELRINTPIAVSQNFTKILQTSLRKVSKMIFSFYKKHQKNFVPMNRENFMKLSICFTELLVPYIQYCVQAIFPTSQVTVYLGISISKLQKEEITFFNQKLIAEPLDSLLPTKNISADVLLSNTLTSRKLDTVKGNFETEETEVHSQETVKDIP